MKCKLNFLEFPYWIILLLSMFYDMSLDFHICKILKLSNCRDKPREGNGNPLQYSCLENHMDREAWWTAVHRVAQSWTRLKWLSSSSRDKLIFFSLYSKYIARSFYSEFVSSYFSSLSVLLRDKNGNWIDRWN